MAKYELTEDEAIIKELEENLSIKIKDYKNFMGEDIFQVSDKHSAELLKDYVSKTYDLDAEIVEDEQVFKVFCTEKDQ